LSNARVDLAGGGIPLVDLSKTLRGKRGLCEIVKGSFPNDQAIIRGLYEKRGSHENFLRQKDPLLLRVNFQFALKTRKLKPEELKGATKKTPN